MKVTKEDIIVYSLIGVAFVFFVLVGPIGLANLISKYLENK